MSSATAEPRPAELDDEAPVRPLLLAGGAGFVLLAAAGTIELALAIAGPSSQGLTAYFTTYFGDNWDPLNSAYGFVHWLPARDWYAGHPPDAHPLPHNLLLFVPFALLPTAWARLLGTVLCAVLVTAGLMLWTGPSRTARRALWPALLSLPVAELLIINHLQAATGLAALSLAVWAQRRDRWGLAGAALAVALLRPGSALPIAVMLLVSGWKQPHRLLQAALGGTEVLAPLLAASFIWDPNWIGDYLANLSHYHLGGAALIAVRLAGPGGFVLLLLVVTAVAGWLALGSAGRPLDLDRTAFVLALCIFSTPFQSVYSGVLVLPAMVRLGSRPGFAAVPWVLSGLAWLAALVVWPIMVGPDRGAAVADLGLVAFWLLIGAYPLLRGRTPSRFPHGAPSESGRSVESRLD